MIESAMVDCKHHWERVRNGHENRFLCTRCGVFGFRSTRCGSYGAGVSNPHSPRASMRVARCCADGCQKDATAFKAAKIWCREHAASVQGYEALAPDRFMEDEAVEALFAQARKAAGL